MFIIMMPLPFIWLCKESIVQVLLGAAVQDSLLSPMVKFGSRHTASIVGIKGIVTSKGAFISGDWRMWEHSRPFLLSLQLSIIYKNIRL